MKTIPKPILKPKTFYINKSHARLIEKEISIFDLKFYQKLLVLLISFSTILIFPESPRQLGNICVSYNSKSMCNVL